MLFLRFNLKRDKTKCHKDKGSKKERREKDHTDQLTRASSNQRGRYMINCSKSRQVERHTGNQPGRQKKQPNLCPQRPRVPAPSIRTKTTRSKTRRIRKTMIRAAKRNLSR